MVTAIAVSTVSIIVTMAVIPTLCIVTTTAMLTVRMTARARSTISITMRANSTFRIPEQQEHANANVWPHPQSGLLVCLCLCLCSFRRSIRMPVGLPCDVYVRLFANFNSTSSLVLPDLVLDFNSTSLLVLPGPVSNPMVLPGDALKQSL